MSMSTTPVSSWKAAAARFAAQRAQAPAGPPPEDNPPLAAPIEHNVSAPWPPAGTEEVPPASLDPQPEAPSPEPAADKPKGRRGRPPGSKNKAKDEPTTDAPGLLEYTMTPEQLATAAGFTDQDIGPPDINPDEFKDNPNYEPAPTFRDFTLSEIAAAAKATGAEVTIHFSGKVA